MYIREQHIEVRQGLQKIASNRTRKLLDAEIDWLLNKNYERFVRSKITPRKDGKGGFEILQDDVDSIRPLVKRGVILPAFLHDDRTVRCPLPGDYAYLTQDESVIKLSPYQGAILQAPATSTGTLHRLAIPLKRSHAATGPYYKQVSITINGSVIFDLGQYALAHDADYTGFTASDEIYALHGYLLKGLIDQGWNAYWEYYGSFNVPRNLIIVNNLPLAGSILIDGTTFPGIASTVNYRTQDFAQIASKYEANRLTASNVVSTLLEVAFYGTQPEFPISELVDKSLFVYTNKTFIVSNTVISYVRKPQRMSLILGTDCELPDGVHQLICDMTVEYVKAMIADPNWQVKLQDDMTRTTLSNP